MVLALLLVALVLLGALTVIGSLHDAPNATALAVRGRALTARSALWLTALFNAVGFGLGALTLGAGRDDWLEVPSSPAGLVLLAAVLPAVIVWELFTWWRAMPSSSTHALVGGLLGASWAGSALGLEDWSGPAGPLPGMVWLPLLVAPLAAFALSWLAVVPLVRLLRWAGPRAVHERSRYVLALGAAVVALGHGMFFGHRVLVLGLVLLGAAGAVPGTSGTAVLAVVLCLLLCLGTLGGGWRIGYTLSTRMVALDPFRAAVAMGVTALLGFGTGAVLREPYSSSHLVAASALGAGSHQRFAAVRAPVVVRVGLTWLLTVPVCAGLAALALLVLSPLL